MKHVVEKMAQAGVLYKKVEPIDTKLLKIRSRVEIYKALDLKRYFALIISVKQKSRILSKDVQKFEDILKKCVLYCDHNFKYKHLLIDAPLCSKAKANLEKLGWKVENDFV